MIKLYENIKQLRKENGWSQDELARKLGYTDRSTIAKIEAGQVDLAESKIMAFAKVFGVKPTDLMGWNGAIDTLPSSVQKETQEFINLYEDADPDVQKAVVLLLKSSKHDA